MQFTIREWTSGWRAHLTGAAALGLVLTFLGPFGTTQALSPGPRALFWLSLVATGLLLALPILRQLGDRPAQPALRLPLVAALASVPQMFIVGWALVQVRPGRVITLSDVPMLYLAVFSIELLIVAIPIAIAARRSAPAAAVPPAASPTGRLRQAVAVEIVALEAEDHYVRVHHRGGSTLVLHRLTDAIAELPPGSGLQVHRGWWVADAAVTDTFVRDQKRWIRLDNGLDVPVSRSNLRAVLDRYTARRSLTA